MERSVKEGLRIITGIFVIACPLLCVACAAGTQVKLKGPLHPEYSLRTTDNRKNLDMT